MPQAASIDGAVVGVVGGVVVLVLAFLVARVVRGDSRFRVVRFGFFIERDRFDDGEPEAERPDDEPA